MAWADLTLVAPPHVVRERIGSVLSEHGLSIEWDGMTGLVHRGVAGSASRSGNGLVFELHIHTSPGKFTVVRLSPPRARSTFRFRWGATPEPKELIDALTMKLQMQGILRGVSVWD